jgi:hypothetical protein
MCRFHETNSKSPLNRYVHCSIATNTGRLSLKSNQFIEEKNGNVIFESLSNDTQSLKRLSIICSSFGFCEEVAEQLFFIATKENVIAA